MQTVTQNEKKTGWRWGVNRWFVLAFMILSYFAAQAYPPIQPHVQLPAEVVFHTGFSFNGQEVNITNTIVAMLVADVILLLIALGVRRATRQENAVPKGISSAVEALLEALYNLTEGTAGKWTKQIFPVFATITLMVLVWNWTELIPGVDSIGWIEPVHAEGVHGFEKEELFPGVYTIVKGEEHAEEAAPAEGDHAEEAGAEEAHADQGYMIVPFVRVASTDLNFTIALALIAVAAVQYIGFKSNGVGYLNKFWNTKTLFKVPIFGVIDFAVGILELISEFAKILSFSFRLFGNIFAGSVLLFVIGSLVPIFAQSGFLMLEFFIGLIQAVVFGMLTMVFMAQATESHGHGDH
ncbi:MAG TPA: ATP synthase F0 subunit A [Chloroflexi bacterium]|nr:ATP synthase F0 subunit A [Chloroflexota bacterium]